MKNQHFFTNTLVEKKYRKYKPFSTITPNTLGAFGLRAKLDGDMAIYEFWNGLIHASCLISWMDGGDLFFYLVGWKRGCDKNI